jgi:hypothetical protein
MNIRHPVSQPLKTNQSATIQSAIQEANRFKNVRRLIMGRMGGEAFPAEADAATAPEDVGLSGGTRLKECAIEARLSRASLLNGARPLRPIFLR